MKKKNKDQCDAQTSSKDKHRCKKNGKILVDNGVHFLCWTHWTTWYKETHLKSPGEPWELLEFSVEPDIEKLGPKTIKSLRSQLRKGPPTTLSKGHIYVFRAVHDDIKDMYKIGFTTLETVQERLRQWPGSILVESWETTYPAYAETLIHLYLQHWRVYRFVLYAAKQRPNEHKRYVSVWYDDPARLVCKELPKKCDWLPDHLLGAADISAFPEFKVKSKNAYECEVEWFLCDYDYISSIINCILKAVEKEWHQAFY